MGVDGHSEEGEEVMWLLAKDKPNWANNSEKYTNLGNGKMLCLKTFSTFCNRIKPLQPSVTVLNSSVGLCKSKSAVGGGVGGGKSAWLNSLAAFVLCPLLVAGRAWGVWQEIASVNNSPRFPPGLQDTKTNRLKKKIK